MNNPLEVLSPEQSDDLLTSLLVRFEQNMQRHAGLQWAEFSQL